MSSPSPSNPAGAEKQQPPPRPPLPNYPKRDDEIDPEQARFLFEHHCALLVVEGLPPSSEFGIDLSCFKVAANFKGLKLIPPGLHFVFASAVDREDRQTGPRCGFYHDFKSKELLIKRWSAKEEDFDDSFEAGAELRERYLLNLRELDRFLGAYRFSTYETYLALTSKLTPALVKEFVPINNRIRSATYLTRQQQPSNDLPVRPKRRTLREDEREVSRTEQDLLPHLQQAEECRLRLTTIVAASDIHHQNAPTSPHLLTRYNLDTSTRLEQTFGPMSDGLVQARLLAEFQFAFLTLILGHVYDCFEHWRDTLELVCHADSALAKWPAFFLEFVRVLYVQLEQVPEELFADITHMDNLVRHHLDIFVQNVQVLDNANVVAGQRQQYEALKSEVDRLRQMAESKFGWIFELERDDELPVVVAADEQL